MNLKIARTGWESVQYKHFEHKMLRFCYTPALMRRRFCLEQFSNDCLIRLLRLVIGLKFSRQYFSQLEARPKPIATCTRDFSRPWVSYMWLLGILIGSSRCSLRLWLVGVITLIWLFDSHLKTVLYKEWNNVERKMMRRHFLANSEGTSFYKKNLIRAKRPELRMSLVQIPRNSLHDFVEFDNNNNIFQHSFNFPSITQQHTDSSSQNPGCCSYTRLLLHGYPSI